MKSQCDSKVRVPRKNALCASICLLGLVGLLSAMTSIVMPSSAAAKPEFAQKTGLPCGQCHSNPAGGGPLKSFGKKFKANGFKVK